MQVTLYATTTCPFCEQEKQFLHEHQVDYIEHLVDRDREKAQEMIQKSGQLGVPFTVIVDDAGEEHHVLGFQRDKLAKLLGLA